MLKRKWEKSRRGKAFQDMSDYAGKVTTEDMYRLRN
jgi:hypothetical protein